MILKCVFLKSSWEIHVVWGVAVYNVTFINENLFVFFCIIVALEYHVLDTCWANEFKVFIFGLYFPTDEGWLSLRNHLHSKFLKCFIFISLFFICTALHDISIVV